MTQRIRLVVPPGSPAERLDRALARLLEGKESRTSVARLIRDGRVSVNGRATRPSIAVQSGDAIDVQLATAEPSHYAAEDVALAARYEDEHLAIIDKPAGMSTHPSGAQRTGTLVNALLHRYRSLSAEGGSSRPGIVHRLDKGTSGLLLVARDDETHRRLARAIAERRVARTYEAVVWGRLAGRLLIDAPIGRHHRDRKKMCVTARGKEARTHVRALLAREVASHVELSLETGRTHQIRVHLAHRGHPLVGDPTYGGRRRALGEASASAQGDARSLAAAIGRPALHARRLVLTHPWTGEHVDVESPRPPDLARLVDLLAGMG